MREAYLWFRQLELRLSDAVRTFVKTWTENRVRSAAASLESVAGVRVFTDIVTVSSANQNKRITGVFWCRTWQTFHRVGGWTKYLVLWISETKLTWQESYSTFVSAAESRELERTLPGMMLGGSASPSKIIHGEECVVVHESCRGSTRSPVRIIFLAKVFLSK